VKSRLALALLLALSACNRHRAADVTLDADAAQRNATAAKTLSDLAAADGASRGPAPAVRDAAPDTSGPQSNSESEPAPAADESDEPATIDAMDEAQSNE
jgi:hypothetical protein